jgi:hypothetical protein
VIYIFCLFTVGRRSQSLYCAALKIVFYQLYNKITAYSLIPNLLEGTVVNLTEGPDVITLYFLRTPDTGKLIKTLRCKTSTVLNDPYRFFNFH